MTSIELGFSNILALPCAISYEIEDGVTTLAVYIGPLFLAVSWGVAR